MDNSALRTALASVAGVIVAAIVVFAVEGLGHALFPPPAGLDLADVDPGIGDQARPDPPFERGRLGATLGRGQVVEIELPGRHVAIEQSVTAPEKAA